MSVGVCSITVEQDSAACICEGVLKAVANSNVDLDMAPKMKEEGFLCMRKGSGRPKTSEVMVKRVGALQSPPKNYMKNKSGNPDSTNNSLAHPEETHDN